LLLATLVGVPLLAVILAQSLRLEQARSNLPVVAEATPSEDRPRDNQATPAPPFPYLVNLDGILQFSDPSECEMTPATAALFNNLMIFDPPEYVGRRGPAVTIPGFENAIAPTFTRTVDTSEGRNLRDNEATLDIPGTWQGLRISKIRVRAMEQSSFWEQQIRFLEPAPRVRARLNEMGFDLPAVGEFREFTGADVASVGMGIEEIPGGSALYCGSSINY